MCGDSDHAATWLNLTGVEDLWSRVCDLDKDYQDPGELPAVISVGDVIHYRNSRGQTVVFTVRAISFFVFDRDSKERGPSKWPSVRQIMTAG